MLPRSSDSADSIPRMPSSVALLTLASYLNGLTEKRRQSEDDSCNDCKSVDDSDDGNARCNVFSICCFCWIDRTHVAVGLRGFWHITQCQCRIHVFSISALTRCCANDQTVQIFPQLIDASIDSPQLGLQFFSRYSANWNR